MAWFIIGIRIRIVRTQNDSTSFPKPLHYSSVLRDNGAEKTERASGGVHAYVLKS
jgi:hypothetical protein